MFSVRRLPTTVSCSECNHGSAVTTHADTAVCHINSFAGWPTRIFRFSLSSSPRFFQHDTLTKFRWFQLSCLSSFRIPFFFTSPSLSQYPLKIFIWHPHNAARRSGLHFKHMLILVLKAVGPCPPGHAMTSRTSRNCWKCSAILVHSGDKNVKLRILC